LKKITLIPLIGVIYFTVSGGAFGLEDLVSSAGPGLALLLLVITPLLWSLAAGMLMNPAEDYFWGRSDVPVGSGWLTGGLCLAHLIFFCSYINSSARDMSSSIVEGLSGSW